MAEMTDEIEVLDTAAFDLDVQLEGKAVVTAADDGDVIIEGLASDIGIDRAGEAFLPGAFDRGIDRFLSTNPVLLYHHDGAKALGQVLDLKPTADGLQMKARIDKPTPGSWAEDVVAKVKKGTIRALSVRGKFDRVMTPKGPRIHTADLAEISVTPFPVNPRTLFAVSQKAFGASDDEQREALRTYFQTRLDAVANSLAEAEQKLCHNDR